jgi:DNA processing protein
LFENLCLEVLESFWFSEKQALSILQRKKEVKLEILEKKLQQRNVRIITIHDTTYPSSLKQISNSPYLFYLRWEIDDIPKISVVWSRKMTSYWDILIEKIVWDISKYFMIVSGWAAGCDTKSHEVALSKWNKTLSVIGTWIDIDYPVGNKKLYDTIVSSGGWVLSIFPIWEVGNPYNFPVRNEIVAWLSVWLIVVEASIKSWTLITANLALDMWKDLFAVPWDVFKSNSSWCNRLIKDASAKLITCSEDVLEEYIDTHSKNYNKTEKQKIKFADSIEKEIYNILLLENLSTDELSRKMWLDIATLSFKLSIMEINQMIRKWVWWKYLLN